MTPFEHLTVLVSIVLGLGITHLLGSVHKLVQARARVRVYWLSLVWATLVFISSIEWWWALFALRTTTQWNFFYFLFMLLSPVTLYLSAAFVLPEVERGERCDLREYYFANRGWFFAITAASPGLDAVRRAVQSGSVTDFGAVSNFVSALLLVMLCVTRKVWVHTVVTAITGGLFLFFIVQAALELR